MSPPIIPDRSLLPPLEKALTPKSHEILSSSSQQATLQLKPSTFTDCDNEVAMYETSAIGPVLIVHHLMKAGLAKTILVSSESGSITLRRKIEGGGNYRHHASKTALNIVGKL